MKDSVFVIGKPNFSDETYCKCGKEAGFVIGIYGQVSHLCAECMADVAKKSIDGLT